MPHQVTNGSDRVVCRHPCGPLVPKFIPLFLRGERRAHPNTTLPASVAKVQAATRPENAEALRSVLVAVAHLSSLLRDIYLAREILQLSEAETSRVLGGRTAAIATGLRRAREATRRQYAPPQKTRSSARGVETDKVIQSVFDRAEAIQTVARELGIVCGAPIEYFIGLLK